MLLVACLAILSMWGEQGGGGAETNEQSAAGSLPAEGKEEKYIITPGDKLTYRVLEDREEPKTLTVSPTSEIEVPYLGRVALENKSLKEAEKVIKVLLEKELYHQATVILSLEAISTTGGGVKPRQISVVGQVKKQGPQNMPPGEKYMLSRAIIEAGGLASFANGKSVQVIRKKPDGTVERIEVNVIAILKDGEIEKDIELKPDDMVIVKESFFKM